MSQLVDRLYARAGIEGMSGHDLRRTFSTLVREASRDEFLAMRLLRDKVPGQGERYIAVTPAQLRAALERYSPFRLMRQKEIAPLASGRVSSGGDGGESNSR